MSFKNNLKCTPLLYFITILDIHCIAYKNHDKFYKLLIFIRNI